MGFKDRHLEDEYLEHLVVASRARIILGYVTVILLYGSGPFAYLWVHYDLNIFWGQFYGFLSEKEKEEFKEDLREGKLWKYFPPTSTSTLYAFLCLVLLIFILGGFVACLDWTR